MSIIIKDRAELGISHANDFQFLKYDEAYSQTLSQLSVIFERRSIYIPYPL